MKLCTEPDCGIKHYARGLCKKHYQRIYSAAGFEDQVPTGLKVSISDEELEKLVDLDEVEDKIKQIVGRKDYETTNQPVWEVWEAYQKTLSYVALLALVKRGEVGVEGALWAALYFGFYAG